MAKIPAALLLCFVLCQLAAAARIRRQDDADIAFPDAEVDVDDRYGGGGRPNRPNQHSRPNENCGRQGCEWNRPGGNQNGGRPGGNQNGGGWEGGNQNGGGWEGGNQNGGGWNGNQNGGGRPNGNQNGGGWEGGNQNGGGWNGNQNGGGRPNGNQNGGGRPGGNQNGGNRPGGNQGGQTTRRPPTTTQATNQQQQAATPNPECERRCLRTPEYNPVCGTNNVSYANAGTLECARRCGLANLQVSRQGNCPPPAS